MVAKSESRRFTVGRWTATPSLDRLERNGETLTIEPTAMAVLVQLALRPGQVVSTDELTEAVWKGRALGDDAVYQRIHRLRSLFHDDPHSARYIETIPKKGYRLIAPVEFLTDKDTEYRPGARRASIAAVLGIVILFVGVSYLIFQQTELWDRQSATVMEETDENSIAVLPFVDLSDEQDQEYLGNGIAEELIHTLSNVAGLRVAARTSTFHVSDMGADIQTVGEQLNVAKVLEGSVRKQGNQLRITAQLVNVSDGFHLWSKTFDRDATDLITIQREIGAAVAELMAETLEIEPREHEIQALDTNIDAYDYYLLARHHLRDRQVPDLEQAVVYFQRAIELDPDFSRAYAGLARAYLYLTDWGSRRYGDKAYSAATTAAKQALAIDEREPEAHSVLGSLRANNGDVAGAIAAHERAVALNPNFVEAYVPYALALGYAGREDERLQALQTAASLDPLSASVQMWLGAYYISNGQRETAKHHWRRSIELEPTYWQAHFQLSNHLYTTGQLDTLVLLLNKYIVNAGDHVAARAYLYLIWCYRAMDDLDMAESWFDRLAASDQDAALIHHERSLALVARRNYKETGEYLHGWVGDALDDPRQLGWLAWYEMIIGHDDHARRLYARVAELPNMTGEEESNLFYDYDVIFGHLPAVNAAHLMIRANEAALAQDLLTKSRAFADKRLEDPWRRRYAGILYVLAAMDAIEGNRTKALNGIRQAINAGWTRIWYTEQDPNFESLRDDPEFKQILAERRASIAVMRKQVDLANKGNPIHLSSSTDQ